MLLQFFPFLFHTSISSPSRHRLFNTYTTQFVSVCLDKRRLEEYWKLYDKNNI